MRPNSRMYMRKSNFEYASYLALQRTFNPPIESTEGVSEIWFCDPFPLCGVHTFEVMVRFTYG